MATPKRAARGGWETWVSVGPRDQRVRVHVRGQTKAATKEVADEIQKKLSHGVLPTDGRVQLTQWLDLWIQARETAGKVRPKTITGYRTDAKWISRIIGRIRLVDLTPEDVEGLYRAMRRADRSAGTVLHVRRTLRAALQTAVDRGRISRNPVTLAEAPAEDTPDIEPMNATEIQSLLDVASKNRAGARWVLALVTGMRQGEVLGLQWNDLRTESAEVLVRRALGRRTWRHGCPETESCSGDRPHRCPRRVGGGLVAGPLKTKSARRTVVIPAQMVDLLVAHRRAQAAERLRVGELWQQGPGGGWVFASEIGTPIDPRNDLRAWTRLLAAANITRPVRIHDLRHTAATLQLVAGTDSRVLQGLFGWSSPALVSRYAHVVDDARRQAASRIGDTLWPNGASG